MRRANEELIWKVCSPPGVSAATRPPLIPAWLDEVWSLRGYVLYDNGKRPGFRVAENCYADPDPADCAAYHVLAYDNAKLVGCVRILPLTPDASSLTESLLGTGPLEQLLRDLGAERTQTAEAGRWLVHPEHRYHNLGIFLAAAGIALARQLEYRIVFCSVGTKDKQHRVLARLSIKPVPIAVESFYSDTFADTLQVMHINPTQPSPRFRAMMDRMAERLRLTKR